MIHPAASQAPLRLGKTIAAVCLALFLILPSNLLPASPLRPQQMMQDLGYIAAAEMVNPTLHDHTHKALLIHLTEPMTVVSTLEGVRNQIRHVGNIYTPSVCWPLYDRIGLEASRLQLMQALWRDGSDTSLLFTGVDMDHVALQRQSFKDMVAYVLVTAGVRSNAVRMARDTGAFYEPGTINIIILANRRLSPGAMQQAIVVATEAKTAALWDMDIRSSQTPLINPATGTGTDNIIVLEGAGPKVENCGGHTRMGELIARAVYAGVQESVFKQNGITPSRPLPERLQERRISLAELAASAFPTGLNGAAATEERLARLLADPTYAGFLEAALALSDQHERGLLTDIGAFRKWCSVISMQISGREVPHHLSLSPAESLPPILQMAFEALLGGLAHAHADGAVP